MGYVPNYFAKSLQSKGGSQVLGVVVPKIRHAFFAETVAGIQAAAAEHNYEILMAVSQEDPEAERRHIETFLSMRVDGLLISVTEKAGPGDLAYYQQIKDRGVPVVFFDRLPLGAEAYSSVVMDDRQGAHEAISAAIAEGFVDIAHLAGPHDVNIGLERRRGYEAAMAQAGLSPRPEWIVEGGFDEIDGYRGFEALWAGAHRPSAIFCVSFPVAVGVVDAMRILAPDALGKVLVVFFGPSDMVRFLPAPHICVVQPAAQMGRAAVETLLAALGGDRSPIHRRLSVSRAASSQPDVPPYLSEPK
jgi:LacI family transcriptional regulator